MVFFSPLSPGYTSKSGMLANDADETNSLYSALFSLFDQPIHCIRLIDFSEAKIVAQKVVAWEDKAREFECTICYDLKVSKRDRDRDRERARARREREREREGN